MAAKQILLAALGGDLGAVCRYGSAFLPVGGAFPIKTKKEEADKK